MSWFPHQSHNSHLLRLKEYAYTKSREQRRTEKINNGDMTPRGARPSRQNKSSDASAWKCNLSPTFRKAWQKDRPTNRQTDMRVHREVTLSFLVFDRQAIWLWLSHCVGPGALIPLCTALFFHTSLLLGGLNKLTVIYCFKERHIYRVSKVIGAYIVFVIIIFA